MKHLSSSLLKGRLLALPCNIILCWKGLLRTNTLAYYENPSITAVKSSIVQALESAELIGAILPCVALLNASLLSVVLLNVGAPYNSLFQRDGNKKNDNISFLHFSLLAIPIS